MYYFGSWNVLVSLIMLYFKKKKVVWFIAMLECRGRFRLLLHGCYCVVGSRKQSTKHWRLFAKRVRKHNRMSGSWNSFDNARTKKVRRFETFAIERRSLEVVRVAVACTVLNTVVGMPGDCCLRVIRSSSQKSDEQTLTVVVQRQKHSLSSLLADSQTNRLSTLALPIVHRNEPSLRHFAQVSENRSMRFEVPKSNNHCRFVAIDHLKVRHMHDSTLPSSLHYHSFYLDLRLVRTNFD